MKIRIFALARDLELDSKDLIEICDQAGVKLRNALATISEEERDHIVNFINERNQGGKGEKAAKDLEPVREPPPELGKVRTIRSMAPRGQHSGTAVQETNEQASVTADVQDTAAEAEESVAADAAATTDAVDTQEPVTEVAAEATDQEVAADASVSEAAVEDSAADEGTAEESTEAPAAEDDTVTEAAADSETKEEEKEDETDTTQPAAAAATEPQKEKPPARRRMQQMREMRPIGSVKDREQSTPKPASGGNRGKGPARPIVAAPPSYVPPLVKKPREREEKVQKPDMALSDIVDRSSPLADQLRQLKSAQARQEERQTDRGGSGVRNRGPVAKGSLLKELRATRQAERQAKKSKRRRRSAPAALKTQAQISFPVTVRALSETIGRPAKNIISILFKEGRMVTINDELTEEEALEVALELGVDLEIKRSRDIEEELLASLDHEDDPETLQHRPPIITVLGHVDHGKTTLVDYIRSSSVVTGEAGGITQHIAAYQVELEGHKLTFVDTPGHAAFGEMRSRGANVTDIVVLVVAADDGVMPQTVECISHARNAKVPIIVALNKSDLPEVDEQKALQQLAQHDMLPAEWGGEIEVVRTSGITGDGVDKLLETILLTAELHELKANYDREAIEVLEGFRDEGRGALAWFVVQKGTLNIGDVVLCGNTYGRIRAMYDDRDNELTEAPPSTPIKVAGLTDVPGAGDHFFVMKDIEEARTTAENRDYLGRSESLSTRGQPRTLEDILSAPRGDDEVQELPLILKSDTPGSMEALRSELEKFEHPEVKVSIVHEGIGGVNESDIYLAGTAGAIIIAFHVIAEDRAQALAERESVDIRRYSIIYEVTQDIKLALQGMLRPERVEVATGRAIVLRTFSISRTGTIAGCRVLKGTIARDNRVHLIRDQKVLNDYGIASLKREKDDAKEVRDGMECGIRLDGFNDIKEGDLLEAFRIDEIQRTLD